MQTLQPHDALQVHEALQRHDAVQPREVGAHDARAEIDRLMAELHGLVGRSESSARAAIGEALPAAAKLQVVRANVDACNPTRRPGVASELVAVADQRMRRRRDATERSLVYTGEATMRRLLGE